MTGQTQSITDATDLPITLYLNQRLTFDLLASLQGGFSSFTTVQTTADSSAQTNAQGGAQFGVENVFGLFGINFGAQGSRQKTSGQSATTTEEIIHTPTSLFAQLRKDLKDRDLVRDFSPTDDMKNLSPGDFIEFEATLRRNPIIDMLETTSTILELVALVDSDIPSASTASGKGRKAGRHRSGSARGKFSDVGKKLEALKSMVNSGKSEDLIAETGESKLVMTVEGHYFIDPSMKDIIDGTFRVLGKVSRVIDTDGESISLFRKAALGKFIKGENILDGLTENLSNVGFKEALETEIPGPTIQVIPIAIYS